MNKNIIKKAEEALRAEVETYNQYLTGDVYGFRQFKINKNPKKCPTCEHIVEEKETEIDSCWGFYGSDLDANGLFGSYFDKNEWVEKR